MNKKLFIAFTLIFFSFNAQEYVIENLGAQVNSADGDNGPVISPDGKTIYFWSTRGGARSFYSELDSLGNWGEAKPMKDEAFKNVEVCGISPDGNRLLVVRYVSSKPTYFFSYKTKTGWSELEELVIEEYSTTKEEQYTNKGKGIISNDGKTIIFPKADPKNTVSKYRTDLVVIFQKEDNTWTKPLNLGPKINVYDVSEITPFISSDNKTLYFSRNLASNDQNFDIYVSTRLDDTWTNWSDPVKLGSNVNDEKWNADYTIPASGDFAYFSSSKNPLKGTYTDLFRIRLKEEEKPNPVILISGKVLDTKTNNPIDAKIIYENLETGERIGSASTNPETGLYKIVLPFGVNYGVTAIAENYISISENLDLKLIAKYQEIEKNLKMTPIEIGQTIRINNLFFETGKSVIKQESFTELDRLVKLLKENPAVKIQINGHTDNEGSLELNKKLSNDRALSVKKYLISKEISETRIISKGFGPSKPVADNKTEEGKQMNRRVEFEILAK
jgi:OmpA-OmpF porin, OOP family